MAVAWAQALQKAHRQGERKAWEGTYAPSCQLLKSGNSKFAYTSLLHEQLCTQMYGEALYIQTDKSKANGTPQRGNSLINQV